MALIVDKYGDFQGIGTAELHRVCQKLGEEMPEDFRVATVGGLLSESLGRIPTEGDTFEWRGYRLTVLSAGNRGVDQVTIVKID
jgi:CBS domain containing-hemolysin-like protein